MSKQFTPQKLPADATPPLKHRKQIVLEDGLIWSLGLFVGIGIAAEIAGFGLPWAITLAALVAWSNRYSATQLAIDSINVPSVQPAWVQFLMDWLWFSAKLTLTATAVLGIAGYFLAGIHPVEPIWIVPTALVAIVILARIAFQRQNMSLPLLVRGAIILSLLGLVLVALPEIRLNQVWSSLSISKSPATMIGLLQATALLSVAYSGVELFESRQPTASSTPIVRGVAIGNTVARIWLLYLAITIISLSIVGPSVLGSTTLAHIAPLVTVIQTLALPGTISFIAAKVMALGAVATMVSLTLWLFPLLADRLVRLNQALSRQEIEPRNHIETPLSPRSASIWLSIALGLILLVGDVKILWSFSAFAYLIHAALIHGVVLYQSCHPRLYRRWISQIGLLACLLLAFWVDWSVWLVSLGLMGLGLVWRGMMQWSDERE